MALTKTQSTTMWILSVLLAALFVFAGSGKLLGAEEVVKGFEQLGLPSWFRLLIGLIEFGCGIGLLIPKVAIDAASFLIIIMLGAVITVLFAGESVIPPLITLILLGSVTALRGDE
jgi:uncharacterized membrane protein YphA (DoxX/SURF4 family)